MAQFSQLQFYSSPLADRMLAHERNWLAEQLRTCVGSHAAIITADPYARLKDVIDDFYFKVSVSSDWQDKNSLCCNPTALPFPNESLDVLVLQHITDANKETVQILREAERVLVPGGRLLLLGENPFSLLAVTRKFYQEGTSPYSHRKGLIKQWLSALDIQVLSTQVMLHELPINNTWLLENTYGLCSWAMQLQLPLGGVFGFSGIKSARPINPIRWNKINWKAKIRPVAAQHTMQNNYEKD